MCFLSTALQHAGRPILLKSKLITMNRTCIRSGVIFSCTAYQRKYPSDLVLCESRYCEFKFKRKLYPDYVYTTLTEVYLTLTEGFPCFFLSCKANARVKFVKTGHGPHSSKLVVICVVLLLYALFVYCLCVNVCCNAATG